MSPSTDSRENREFAEEMKFVVARGTGDQIREWARARLSPDPNATSASGDEYRITSIYFDTPQFDVYRRIDSYGRSKYRIRKYGVGEQVFLERKLKTRGLVTKRRSLVPLEQLARLATTHNGARWGGAWYHQRLLLRKLRPVCQIAYNRTARVMMTEHGPIRLTIDENLEAAPSRTVSFESASGLVISPHQFIIEVKFRAMLPPLFKSLIQEFALAPAAISKYRLAVVELGLVPSTLLADPRPAQCESVCLSS
jgi:hypothetical protein